MIISLANQQVPVFETMNNSREEIFISGIILDIIRKRRTIIISVFFPGNS